jgi:2-oxo-3-hexenedioate decarboxylase
MDIHALAQEIFAAYQSGMAIATPPASREDFGLTAAYATEAEFTRLRSERGHVAVGRKVGYSNRALWSKLGLTTVLWGNMYDDTVHYATAGQATFALGRGHAPKIEPEIVVKMKRAAGPDVAGARGVLEAMEWLAVGFEIVDCPYPGWQFRAPDFVATWGFHSALVVGSPLAVEAASIPAIEEALGGFTARLVKDGVLVDQGSGANCFGSPALCVEEVAHAVAKQAGARPLAAGELISTGSLTPAQLVKPGETWRAEIEGLPIANLELRFT